MPASRDRNHACVLVASCVAAMFLLAACPGGGSSKASPTPTSPTTHLSPSQQVAPPYTMTVTVQAGGDCREFDDNWEIRGAAANGKKTKLLATGTDFRRTQSDPPGLIPCQFDFEGKDLPTQAAYFVVNKTIDRGWGPWTVDALQRRGWHVTVAITDLN